MVDGINGGAIVKNLTGGTMDIQQLATSLVDATRAPQQAILDQRQASATARLSSIGKIQSAAQTFRNGLDTFGDARAIPYSPVSTNDKVAKLSFKSYLAPTAVNFSFRVTQLATDNQISISGLTNGPFQINLNGVQSASFTKLTDLQSWIKTQSGYNATVVNGKDLIISKGTGAQNNFVVAIATSTSTAIAANGNTNLTNITGGGIAQFPGVNTPLTYKNTNDLVSKINATGTYTAALDPNNTGQIIITGNGNSAGSIVIQSGVASTGQDAEIIANNVSYKSASNRFSNLIPNANIDIFSTSPDEVVVGTQTNTSDFVNILQTIVDGYNQVLKSLTAEMKYDPDVKKRGGLANDTVSRSLLSQMRRLTTDPIKGYSSNYPSVTLAEVGVATNRDGTLKLDTALVEKLVQNDPGRLEAALASTNSSKGALDRMKNLTDTFTGRNSALQQLSDRTQNKDIRAIEDDKAKLDIEMTALLNRYLTQFTQMQSLVTMSQKTQDNLTSMMTAWTAGLKNG